MEKKNYQFTQVPTNLFILLDNNCRSMLFTLIQLSSYYADEEGWFFRTYQDLEQESNLSKNLVEATIQTLFNHHLIEAKPTGYGKGKKPNYYKVNFEEFSKYDEVSVEDAMKNPDLKIRTVNYKGSNFKLNLVREVVKETVTKLVKSDNNIYNIENVYNIENKENVKNRKRQFEIECKNENIEEVDTNSNEDIVDKDLEKELETAIEQTLIPNGTKKVEVKKQFVHCDTPIKKKPQIPDMEDLSQYLKRTRTYSVKTFS